MGHMLRKNEITEKKSCKIKKPAIKKTEKDVANNDSFLNFEAQAKKSGLARAIGIFLI